MTPRALPALVLAAAAPLALTGCLGVTTTQDKSAAKAKVAGKRLATQKGLTVGALNASVKVEGATVVQDPNGVAAVVRLRNTGATQVTLPVAITVTDAKGTKLYANDTPGLDPSLTSLAVLAKGEEGLWVNNQILVSGKAAKVDVRVGAAKGTTTGALPKIEISDLAEGHDEDGSFATGMVRNASAVEQKRLTVFCIAAQGATVRAAGRAVIERLAPLATAKKPTKFTVFFIGDPHGATLRCAAPPTVLPGGAAR